MFCPKCGSILLPKTVDGKKVMACSCGYRDRKASKISESGSKDHGKIEVVDKSEENKILPKTDAECDKCGHKTAYYWTVQTRAGDEAETKFLKCESCSHIWRDYG